MEGWQAKVNEQQRKLLQLDRDKAGLNKSLHDAQNRLHDTNEKNSSLPPEIAELSSEVNYLERKARHCHIL